MPRNDKAPRIGALTRLGGSLTLEIVEAWCKGYRGKYSLSSIAHGWVLIMRGHNELLSAIRR